MLSSSCDSYFDLHKSNGPEPEREETYGVNVHVIVHDTNDKAETLEMNQKMDKMPEIEQTNDALDHLDAKQSETETAEDPDISDNETDRKIEEKMSRIPIRSLTDHEAENRNDRQMNVKIHSQRNMKRRKKAKSAKALSHLTNENRKRLPRHRRNGNGVGNGDHIANVKQKRPRNINATAKAVI